MGNSVASLTFNAGKEGGESSFRYSFTFLPKIQRDALKTVYAFCRVTDDIVDNERDATTNLERLQQWRGELEYALKGSSQYPLLNRLNTIARTFNIPVDHFYELIQGVEMDLTKKRYATFDELYRYCYLVASSVGLMSLEIFGPRNEQTKEYAVNLGIALQLTNILRDVSIDARYGRMYLPQEDLRRFNYSEEDLFARRYTPEFRALMEFETARAEDYFLRARQSLPSEDRRTMFAAKIMERIYYHTLLRIKRAKFNVFDRTVHLPKHLQFLIAVKYWMTQRVFGIES